MYHSFIGIRIPFYGIVYPFHYQVNHMKGILTAWISKIPFFQFNYKEIILDVGNHPIYNTEHIPCHNFKFLDPQLPRLFNKEHIVQYILQSHTIYTYVPLRLPFVTIPLIQYEYTLPLRDQHVTSKTFKFWVFYVPLLRMDFYTIRHPLSPIIKYKTIVSLYHREIS